MTAKFENRRSTDLPEWTATQIKGFSWFLRLIAAGRASCLGDYPVAAPATAIGHYAVAAEAVGEEIRDRFGSVPAARNASGLFHPHPPFFVGEAALGTYLSSIHFSTMPHPYTRQSLKDEVNLGEYQPHLHRVRQGSPLFLDVILPGILCTAGGISTICIVANRAHRSAVQIRKRHLDQELEDTRRDRCLMEERVRIEEAIVRLEKVRYSFPGPEFLEFWDAEKGPSDPPE